MTGDGEPASYPPTDTSENQSISLLNYLLDEERIKADIERRDKQPNHDGTVEIVDENQTPLGRLTVQVKKLPSNSGSIKKRVKTDTLWYSKRIAEPFLLIVVDLQGRKAYWIHISEEWVENAEIEGQTTKTVHFPEDNVISQSSMEYIDDWLSIHDRSKNRIENFRLFEDLKENLNPAIGESDPRFKNIHRFLDSYNRLLRNEFSILKERMYSDTWKFGYVDNSYEDDSVHYALYPISYEDNDIQIKYMEPDDIDQAFRDYDLKVSSGYGMRNPIKENPKQAGYNALRSDINRLFERDHLDYNDSEFIATEYLFSFLDEYGELLGLTHKDKYSIQEIYDGYYRYLQFWLEEMIEDLDTNDHSKVTIGLQGILDHSGKRLYPKHLRIKKKAEKSDENPPVYNFDSRVFNRSTVEEMISVLSQSSIDTIERPYPRPEQELSNGGTAMNQYSRDGIIQGIKSFYSNLYSSYDSLMSSNFPAISSSLESYPNDLLVIVIEESSIENETGPAVLGYWLETDEPTREISIHLSGDDEVEDLDSGHTTYRGERYNCSRRFSQDAFFKIFSEDTPVKKEVEDNLRDAVEDYVEDKGAPVKPDNPREYREN